MDCLSKQWIVHIYHLYHLIRKKKVSKNIDMIKILTLGLNLLDFGKVLKLIKPNDIMTIWANEENSFLTIKNIIKVSNI